MTNDTHYLALLVAASAWRNLRWDDVDFPNRRIHWRAETDKQGHDQVVPMSQAVHAALAEARRAQGAIGSRAVFPAPKDAARPCSRYLFDAWLRRAFQLAGVTRESAMLWHALRRKWATERKGFPVKDVMQAGGWLDEATLVASYQHTDPDTVRRFVREHRASERGAHLRLVRRSTPGRCASLQRSRREVAPDMDIAVEITILAKREEAERRGVEVVPGPRELLSFIPRTRWAAPFRTPHASQQTTRLRAPSCSGFATLICARAIAARETSARIVWKVQQNCAEGRRRWRDTRTTGTALVIRAARLHVRDGPAR
jgi:hypothetical protein